MYCCIVSILSVCICPLFTSVSVFSHNCCCCRQNKRLQHELELEKSRASLGTKFQQSLDNSMTSGNPGLSADALDGWSHTLIQFSDF